MSDPINSLFTPQRLGRKVVLNRIVFASHRTNFAERNLFGERHLRYYLARARGEAGVTRKSGQVLEGPPGQMAAAILAFLRERHFIEALILGVEAPSPHDGDAHR